MVYICMNVQCVKVISSSNTMELFKRESSRRLPWRSAYALPASSYAAMRTVAGSRPVLVIV